ncbi:MAG TPA: cell surface protein SprA, partial [Bacteroidota bacterium]
MASDRQTSLQGLSRNNLARRSYSHLSFLPLLPLWLLFVDQNEGTKSTASDSITITVDSARSTSVSIDTTSAPAARDTTAHDSTTVVPVDSSARIRQFTHFRTDYPQVFVNSDPPHPLFLKNKYTIHEIVFDTTGENVTVRETLLGKDVKIPIRMGLDEYIHSRLKGEQRDSWELIARQYSLKQQSADDLQSLLGDITNIDIPIPANPLFSIFGPPKINLRISGAVDIRAAFRNSKSDQTVISRLGSTRNEPDFNQEVQILVSGTVGDKLNINADWNTQRTFEYENQLKIKYTGYDDEIVRSVEAGNVSLPTPSGFVGSSQALFGVKSQFQLGPLTLTTIASQKRGQVKELTITGGSQAQQFVKRAYDYSTNHYFLDVAYRGLFRAYYSNPVPQVDISKRVTDIEVWATRLGIEVPEERDVIAYIDLPPIRESERYSDSLRTANTATTGQVELGRFIRLDRNQYLLHPETGYISLNVAVQNEQAIAVAYRAENDPSTPSDDLFEGEFVKDDTTNRRIVLKLVKPRYLVPQFKPAWDLLLKNIYPLGGKNIKEEGFELNVLYQLPGQEPQDNVENQNLLQVFGLDKYDASGGGSPDGRFDFISNITVDAVRGELIFPVLEPFDEGVREYFTNKGLVNIGDSVAYAAVYDTTVNGARNNTQRDRFLIQGKSSAEVTSTYNLGFNVVEGSVEAYLGERKLTQGVDYTVDYILGQVVIRNEEALLPNSNIRVKFESNDLFQLASKTLLGARGDMQLSKDTKLGFTMMNLNQQTLSDKVRMNEEPIKNLIVGFDGSTKFDVGILSDILDKIPLLKARETSTVTLSGEAAYMNPDPNTKKSPIPSDEGGGIAYIDDFEGAERTIPLGTSYGFWRPASPPAFIESFDPSIAAPIDPRVKMLSKAKSIWYNIIPSDVGITDIWPNSKRAIPGQDRVTVLDIGYDPTSRGEFNYSMDLQSSLFGNPSRNWGGLMRLLSSTANNLIDENINFIEIWMKVEGNPDGGKLLIDLGQISEDLIPNDTLNSEDGLDGGIKNGTLNPAVEDVGLDMISDADERIRYAQFVAKYPQYADDPSGDDWSYSVGSFDFSRINGSEKNAGSEFGNFPDTEDLNRTNNLDINNSYFEYEVSLDTTGGIGGSNSVIVGGGNNGWYQFRIPLAAFTRKVGTPSFEVVEFMRMWFTGFNSPVTVRIADFNLVGNQWQEQVRNDSLFSVTTVSLEDNPNYTSPPGVIRERDRTRPDQEIFSNEQSLALFLNGIQDGQSRQAVRFYSFRPLDLFNYRTMKMFVHGDPSFVYIDTTNYDAEVFIRFGLDSLNYYEYREPVHPGWDEVLKRNDVTINFSELTAVKQGQDSAGTLTERVPVPDGPPGATYQVRGKPTLTQVKYIAIGVENPSNKGTVLPLFGEIWANELRLSSVDDKPGWAYRMGGTVKLADFGNVGFTVTRIDPHFHALDQRFGTRSLNRSWSFTSSVALDKFFPDSWKGTSVPLTYSHTEGSSRPRYLPGTDVLVEEAVRRQEQVAIEQGATPEEASAQATELRAASETVSIQDNWAIPTMKVLMPSNKWFIRDTFNRLSFGANYNRGFAHDPVTEYRQGWAWTGRMSYGLGLQHDFSLKPFGWFLKHVPVLNQYKDFKIFLAPQSFSWGVSAARMQSREKVRTQQEEKPVLRNFTAQRNVAFGWKLTEGGLANLSTDYSLSVASSLVHLETDSLGRPRPFSAILGDIFFGDKLVNFGIDQNYQQRVALTSKPKIPNILDINKYLDIASNY